MAKESAPCGDVWDTFEARGLCLYCDELRNLLCLFGCLLGYVFCNFFIGGGVGKREDELNRNRLSKSSGGEEREKI